MTRHAPARLGLTAAATALLATAAVLPALPVPAGAATRTSAALVTDEVYRRTPDGVFAVDGHGWGHGAGMSQYGAQGAALAGVTADRIVATYYAGTTSTTLATDAPIRVRLSDDGVDTVVAAAPGLVVADRSSSAAPTTLPAGPLRWRVTVTSTGLHLSSSTAATGGTWTAYAMGGRLTLAGPVRFSGPATVRVQLPGGVGRGYRGGVQAVARTTSSLTTVNVLPLDSYLLGVVPREAVTSWEPAALQAQALAARSYSAYQRAAHAASAYDICDSTTCQVYLGARSYSSAADTTGTSMEPASTTAAVRATARRIRTYAGRPILAQFSASDGGWTVDGGLPYLRAQRDDWDALAFTRPDNLHSWTAALTATDLQRRYPAVGTLLRLRVTGRDGNGQWGGRVTSVVLEGVDAAGAATRVTTTGSGVYAARAWPAHAHGLRSRWWHVRPHVDTAIDTKWYALGGAAGVLGNAASVEVAVTGGRSRRFVGGDVPWSSTTGAVAVRGGFLTRYRALSGPAGVLGFPTHDGVYASGGWRQSFQHGRMYWTRSTATRLVRGAILSRYLLGGGPSAYGFPTTDAYAVAGGLAQDFVRARITWSSATGATTVTLR